MISVKILRETIVAVLYSFLKNSMYVSLYVKTMLCEKNLISLLILVNVLLLVLFIQVIILFVQSALRAD